jgi:hypothetical protein
MDADVLGCINIQRQTTFNASHPALEASCQFRDSRVHINEILVSNDPDGPVKTLHWPPVVAPSNVSTVPCIGNSAMVYSPVSPTWRSPPVSPIVLLLHAPSQAAVAGELVRVWQPSIPGADVFTVSVVEGGRADFAGLPAALFDGSGACKRPLVLVGVCGAENTALRLGFDRRLPQCAGVLIAGRVMPPLGPLAVQMPGQVGRLRLIWEVSDA